MSLEAAIAQHDQRLAQLASGYASELNRVRLDAVGAINRLEQQLGKLEFQQSLGDLCGADHEPAHRPGRDW